MTENIHSLTIGEKKDMKTKFVCKYIFQSRSTISASKCIHSAIKYCLPISKCIFPLHMHTHTRARAHTHRVES